MQEEKLRVGEIAHLHNSHKESSIIVLIADLRVLSISVQDNQEPIIDLAQQQSILYGPSPEIPNNQDYTKLRKTVYEKLKQAQELLPHELRFCLYEGYRSLALQKTLFDTRFALLKKEYPLWSDADIFVENTKLISPVINQDGSKNVPPHSTGGAIDVYLVDNQGRAVDMGIHPKDWIQDTDGSISLTLSDKISPEAQRNRTIMSDALSAVGFANYPTEYWHWSYGDRYWAYVNHKPYALYGSILQKIL